MGSVLFISWKCQLFINNFIMEEKIIMAVCVQPEFDDTKFFIYQNRAAIEKAWHRVSGEFGLSRK